MPTAASTTPDDVAAVRVIHTCFHDSPLGPAGRQRYSMRQQEHEQEQQHQQQAGANTEHTEHTGADSTQSALVLTPKP